MSRSPDRAWVHPKDGAPGCVPMGRHARHEGAQTRVDELVEAGHGERFDSASYLFDVGHITVTRH